MVREYNTTGYKTEADWRREMQLIYILGCYVRRHGGILMRRTEVPPKGIASSYTEIEFHVSTAHLKTIEEEMRKTRGWQP